MIMDDVVWIDLASMIRMYRNILDEDEELEPEAQLFYEMNVEFLSQMILGIKGTM